jgi:hypothetical protein
MRTKAIIGRRCQAGRTEFIGRVGTVVAHESGMFRRASIPVWTGELESEMSNKPIDRDEIRDPMSPREQIMANVAVIKQAIKLD